MLYQFHEMNRMFMAPLMQWAEATATLYSNPASPLAVLPYAQRIAAGYELLYRLGKEYEKPNFELNETLVDGESVNIVEETIVTKPFCRLLHFKKDLPARRLSALKQPKVLLVAPMSGHHATLLRDTVRALLPEHDVYITDWTDARIVPVEAGPFHLHD